VGETGPGAARFWLSDQRPAGTIEPFAKTRLLVVRRNPRALGTRTWRHPRAL